MKRFIESSQVTILLEVLYWLKNRSQERTINILSEIAIFSIRVLFEIKKVQEKNLIESDDEKEKLVMKLFLYAIRRTRILQFQRVYSRLFHKTCFSAH